MSMKVDTWALIIKLNLPQTEIDNPLFVCIIYYVALQSSIVTVNVFTVTLNKEAALRALPFFTNVDRSVDKV